MPRSSCIDTPFTVVADGIRVAIRLTPRAAVNRIDGIARTAEGIPVLKVSVTAPPAEERANEALIALLAKEWRLPKRDVSIAGGAKSRNKTVYLAGDPRALLTKLAAALALLPGS